MRCEKKNATAVKMGFNRMLTVLKGIDQLMMDLIPYLNET